jgi:hypothetical protein
VVTLALPKVDIQVLPVNKVVMDNSNRITHKITMGNRKVDIPHQDIDGSAASQPASGHWNTNDITKLDYIYFLFDWSKDKRHVGSTIQRHISFVHN